MMRYMIPIGTVAGIAGEADDRLLNNLAPGFARRNFR